MAKFIIEEFLDGEFWDSYTGEVIVAGTYEEALERYKESLLDSGDFTQEEIDNMKYRSYASTKYVLRWNDEEKTYVRMYNSRPEAIKWLQLLGDEFCIEEVFLDRWGEPLDDGTFLYFEDLCKAE